MIPKLLHLCWLSGDPYPELIQRCLGSWARHLPDYEVKIWNRTTFDLDGTAWVAEAAACGKYAFAADYIRLHALYYHGGVYLDADVEVLRNFDDLLQLRSFMGLESGGDLEPAVMGAVPHAEWVGHSLNYYQGRHFLSPDGARDQKPLPLILGEVLNSHYRMPSEPFTGRVDIEGAGLSLFDASYFSPKQIHSKTLQLAQHSYAVHHFDGHWVDQTWQHTAKQLLHRSLFRLCGSNGHKAIVGAIRRLK